MAHVLALALLPLLAALYVSANIFLVRVLTKQWQPCLVKYHNFTVEILTPVSTTLIWMYCAFQLVALSVVALVIRGPQSIWAHAVSIGIYVFLAGITTIVLLAQLAGARKIWASTSARIALFALPTALLVVSGAIASARVADQMGMTSTSFPFAVGIATIQTAALLLGLLLLALALIVEVFSALTIFGQPSEQADASAAKNRPGSIFALFLACFLTLFGIGFLLQRLGDTSYGSALISSVAYEFDASPATYCSLNSSEQSQFEQKSLKVVHLNTGVERAITAFQPDWLVKDISLRDFRDSQDWRLRIGRVVDCFRSQPINSPP